MKEILGNHLANFFVEMKMQNESYNDNLMRTYKGDRYEVYSVSDELFNAMCDMSEEKFVELAGENAWWSSSEGSILAVPDTKVCVNGHEMLGWGEEDWYDEDEDEELDDDEDEGDEYVIYANNLSDYLCDVVGASQPRNVCALAVDLAKYNNMTMGELFKKYEG